MFSVFLLSCHCARAAKKRMTLKNAMRSKTVSVQAVSTGGYCDKSLKLELKNNTCDDIALDIEPGLIFRPEDTSLQDLVVLGNESLALAPEKKGDIILQTFCGKSYAHSPFPGRPYHFLKQADSNLTRTLKYVKANNVEIYTAQAAVWFFTNGHSLSSVYSAMQPRESENMVKFIADMLHMKIPEYFINYKTASVAGRPVIDRAQIKLEAVMHWTPTDGYRNMHLVVFRENGTVYKTIEADQVIDRYGYTVKVEFDPRRDQAGKYLVKLFDDAGKVWGQKTVVIDPNEYQVPGRSD